MFIIQSYTIKIYSYNKYPKLKSLFTSSFYKPES